MIEPILFGVMKGLVGKVLIFFCVIITVSGVLLLLNRPTGVGVDCSGRITGFGVPSYPLTSFESGCAAEVEASLGNETVCSGSGRVRGEASVIACRGLDEYRGDELVLEARFYNGSSDRFYVEDSGVFFSGR